MADDLVASSSESWHLILYVAGGTTRATAAVVALRAICERYLAGRYQIEVIDLLVDPGRGETDNILALPTVVRRRPRPLRKVIGDLTDQERVVAGLEITTDSITPVSSELKKTLSAP